MLQEDAFVFNCSRAPATSHLTWLQSPVEQKMGSDGCARGAAAAADLRAEQDQRRRWDSCTNVADGGSPGEEMCGC